MSPRKSRYRVPEWKIHLYRAKTKRMLSGPYTCPKCKRDRLRIEIDKLEVKATCNCGLDQSLNFVSSYDPVDYYNKLIDQLGNKE